MRTIVTGASGFVGRNLTKGLLEAGHEVTAIVRNPDRVPDCWNGRAEVVALKLENIRNLGSILHPGFDTWYHFGWSSTSGPGRGDVKLQLKNVDWACESTETAAELGCRRFVNAGSIMEFEAEYFLRQNRGVPTTGYIYSTAKLCADMMLRTVCASRKIEYIHAVISNIYGVGEESPRFLNTMLRKLLHNEHVACTEGKQLYDFIYVSDAVQKLIFLGENGIPSEDYYIGNPEPKPLKEFILSMYRLSESKSVLGFGEVPFNGPFLDYRQFDPGKLERMGCKNQFSFEAGVIQTMEWMRNVDK